MNLKINLEKFLNPINNTNRDTISYYVKSLKNH